MMSQILLEKSMRCPKYFLVDSCCVLKIIRVWLCICLKMSTVHFLKNKGTSGMSTCTQATCTSGGPPNVVTSG